MRIVIIFLCSALYFFSGSSKLPESKSIDTNISYFTKASQSQASEGYHSSDNREAKTTIYDPLPKYKVEKPETKINTYVNSFGETVQSPTKYNSVPEGACAVCRDGTYSFSRNRRGTCSRHGGVARWLTH